MSKCDFNKVALKCPYFKIQKQPPEVFCKEGVFRLLKTFY